jgi:hypothetical protein
MMASFSTTLPVTVLTRPLGSPPGEWRELDQGPGVIHLPESEETGARLRNIGDQELEKFAAEAGSLDSLAYLNLSENRAISDGGLRALKAFPHLRILNLSSCGITNRGLEWLKYLDRLENLDLSYCNRLNDLGLKSLAGLRELSVLNLRGCVKVTHAGIARLRRPGLEIIK